MASVICDQKQTVTNDDVSNCNTPDTGTEPHKKKPTMIVRLKTRLAVEGDYHYFILLNIQLITQPYLNRCPTTYL